jgi:CheY-like chemotaxis protein
MRNSVTNLYRLLENLLHWSKMKQGLIPFVPSVIKLRPAVDESLSIMVELAREKGIEIICRIPDGLEISADSNMLQTVIRNLVSNALKFTSAGGSITVKAKITNDNGVEISVTDSGIGMNRELINNLFHIDARVARRGTAGESSTGLGLILCKEFIEKHGGTLLVESEEGKGSTFAFTIPGPKTVEPDNAIPAGKGKKIKKLKILIVDDDEASELLLRTTFKTSGSEILIAHTGVEAVAMCWKHPDIDLVLLDIEMPSMSGTEAARQIRKFNNDVIIIAQTACVVDGEINRVIAAGCNDYIAKPISQTELKKLMKKYF